MTKEQGHRLLFIQIKVNNLSNNRPCAIVLTVRHEDESSTVVTVAPITHSPPHDLAVAMEIPARVKQHLGLDSERSWIVLDDFNEFTWPGYDLRPVPGSKGSVDYGMLSPRFFRAITEKIAEVLATTLGVLLHATKSGETRQGVDMRPKTAPHPTMRSRTPSRQAR